MKHDPETKADGSYLTVAGHVCEGGTRNLSKREYFAALAMQGMTGLETGYKRLSAEIARAAVIQADALIAALNEEPE